MKRIVAVLLTALLVLGFSACGEKETQSDSSAASSADAASTTAEVFVENGVEIEKAAFPKDTVVKVEPIKTDDKKVTTIKTAIPQAQTIVAYEITATSNNVAVQPDGTVKVSFPIPTDYDAAKHDVTVYYVSDDGKTEAVPTALEGGAVKATLSHFSTYAVVLTLKIATNITSTADTSSASAASKPQSKPESKPATTSSAVASKPATATSSATASKPAPATTAIEGKKYHLYKMKEAGWCFSITFDFGATENGRVDIGYGLGENFETYWKIYGEATKEDAWNKYKDELFEYNGAYYGIGMGGGGGANLDKATVGSITFTETAEDADEPGTCTIEYVAVTDTTIKITKLTNTIEVINEIKLAVGDILTLEK